MKTAYTRRFTPCVTRTLVLSVILMLVGCNTVEGVGKDVKSTGKGLEEAAQEAK